MKAALDFLLNLPGIHYFATRCAGDRVAGYAYNARHRGSWKGYGEASEVTELVGDLVEENSGQARFVLFGGGRAKIIHDLDLDDFRSITCIDLSDAALADAQEEFGSFPNIQFNRENMCDYSSEDAIDLFAWFESIYYIRLDEMKALLARLNERHPAATYLVTITDPGRYAKYLECIRGLQGVSTIRDGRISPRSPRHVLAFRFESEPI